MLDFNSIFKVKSMWNSFTTTHPKFKTFVDDIKGKGFVKDQEIAIAIRYPDGTEFKTGIRVQESDLELLNTLKNLSKNM